MCAGGAYLLGAGKGISTMCNLKASRAIAALALIGAAFGGCPVEDELLQDTALPADAGVGESADDSAGGADADKAGLLEDLASQIAAGSGGYEYAWSDGSTTISINPNTDGGGSHGDDSVTDSDSNSHDDGNGAGNEDDDSGDSDDTGDSGGSDDSGDSGDDPTDEPSGSTAGNTYQGAVQCAYRESLWDDEQFYGEITDDVTYEQTISFNDQGVPASIAVHPFICNDHTVRFETTMRFVGQTETFTFDSGSLEYDVTVRVVAATYTSQTAHVELSLDFAWLGGGGTSIVAAGTHTLDTQVVGSDLVYTAYTGYEGVFTAADDWVGYGTTEYDCSGTLAGP
jgi:hypothetical protein